MDKAHFASQAGDEYSDIALDHAQNPRNNGMLHYSNGYACLTGSCGDTMEIYLLVRQDIIEKAAFVTDGCDSSHACGSMATCLVQGRSLWEAASLEQRDVLDALGGLPEEVRHCARLAADTMRAACEDYMKNKPMEATATPEDTAQTRRPGESDKDYAERQKLAQRLCRIQHKIVVLSGKGGVGKSTVAVNLAVALCLSGCKAGLLDIDVHGPSIPTMLGLEGQMVKGSDGEILPLELNGLKVLSLGFFIRDPDNAVIWRGPMKMKVIKQFLMDTAWGDLDFLIIDSPPGTGDEPLSLCQLIGKLDGAIVVTTPQKVAIMDVRKSISFCHSLEVPVLGVIENMSGFLCPHCGHVTSILLSGGGHRLAEEMKVPFLGSIPIDPAIAEACDGGYAFVSHNADSPTTRIMLDIVQPILTMK
jgi:Mrp family chromosome partitioning ATPase